MINNFTDKEILAFAKNKKLVNFRKWFNADAMPTGAFWKDKFIENYFKPTQKGYFVAYGGGYSSLFDPDGNYAHADGGHHDDVKDCIRQWAAGYTGCFGVERLEDYYPENEELCWELTPIARPSNDFIMKCKISYVKDLIDNCEENGQLFKPEDFIMED